MPARCPRTWRPGPPPGPPPGHCAPPACQRSSTVARDARSVLSSAPPQKNARERVHPRPFHILRITPSTHLRVAHIVIRGQAHRGAVRAQRAPASWRLHRQVARGSLQACMGPSAQADRPPRALLQQPGRGAAGAWCSGSMHPSQLTGAAYPARPPVLSGHLMWASWRSAPHCIGRGTCNVWIQGVEQRAGSEERGQDCGCIGGSCIGMVGQGCSGNVQPLPPRCCCCSCQDCTRANSLSLTCFLPGLSREHSRRHTHGINRLEQAFIGCPQQAGPPPVRQAAAAGDPPGVASQLRQHLPSSTMTSSGLAVDTRGMSGCGCSLKSPGGMRGAGGQQVVSRSAAIQPHSHGPEEEHSASDTLTPRSGVGTLLTRESEKHPVAHSPAAASARSASSLCSAWPCPNCWSVSVAR